MAQLTVIFAILHSHA